MIRRIAIAVALLGATVWAADRQRTPEEEKALVEGQLPDEPARLLVQGKCMFCHTGEYVTQQRLTQGQWEKTVEKMRKFGTPANDEESKAIVAYLARYWTPDLPPPHPVHAPLPPGSIPGKGK